MTHICCRCNTDPALLKVLAAAGTCFDCASEAEIRAVAALGVGADRIIFANACKRPSDIRWVAYAERRTCTVRLSYSMLLSSPQRVHKRHLSRHGECLHPALPLSS